jgi:hypothetical protein
MPASFTDDDDGIVFHLDLSSARSRFKNTQPKTTLTVLQLHALAADNNQKRANDSLN